MKPTKLLSLVCALAILLHFIPITTKADDPPPELPELSLSFSSGQLVFEEGDGQAPQTKTAEVSLSGELAAVSRIEAVSSDGSLFTAELTGSDDSYTLAVTADKDVTANDSATITVTAYGEESAVLASGFLLVRVEAPEPEPPQVNLALTPSSLDFRQGAVGSERIKTVAVALTGDDVELVKSITAESDNESLFSTLVTEAEGVYTVTVTAGASIAEGDAATISVTAYDEESAALATADLSVTVGAPFAAVTLTLGETSLTFREGAEGEALSAPIAISLDDLDHRVSEVRAASDNESRFTANITEIGGVYTLTVIADALIAESDTATVTVTAYGPGDAELAGVALSVSVNPAAAPEIQELAAAHSMFADEEASLDFTVTDGNNPPLTLTVTADSDDTDLLPVPQVESLGDGNYRLTLAPTGIGGAATVTVTAANAKGKTSTATVLVTLWAAPNIEELAAAHSMFADEEAALDFTVTDGNNPPLTLTVTADSNDADLLPVPQVESLGDGNYRLPLAPAGTPGSATVTITATNAKGKATVKTLLVTLMAEPSFDPDLAENIFETDEDTPKTIDLAAFIQDPNSVGALALAASDPVGGTVSLNGTELTFTPQKVHTTPAGGYYSGSADVIVTYQKGGEEKQAEGQVKFKILSVEDAPTAVNDTADHSADEKLISIPIGDLLENDSTIEVGGIEFVSLGEAAHDPDNTYAGTVGLSDDGLAVEYLPNIRYVGEVTIPYTIKNVNGSLTATANLILNISQGANLPPVISVVPSSIVTAEDNSPNENKQGTYSFQFTVTDEDILSLDDLIIGISSDNQLVLKNESISWDIEETPDGNTRTYTVSLAFEPNANTTVRYGDLGVLLEVTDDRGGKDSRTIPITITEVNDPPSLAIDPDSIAGTGAAMTETAPGEYKITMKEDATATFRFTVTDIDLPLTAGGEPDYSRYLVEVTSSDDDNKVFALTGFAWSTPVVGDDNNTLTYTVTLKPNKNANTHQKEYLEEDVTFALKVIDNGGEPTATATLVVDVEQVNDAPTAKANTYTIDKDDRIWIDVLALCSDIDGHQTLSIDAVHQTTDADAAFQTDLDGTLSILPDPYDSSKVKVWYIPPLHVANVTDSFTYTVVDDAGAKASAKISIKINFVNHKPALDGLRSVDNPYQMLEEQADFAFSFTVYDDTVLLKDIATVVVAQSNGDLIADVDVLAIDPDDPGKRVITIIPALNKNSYGNKLVRLKITIGDGEHLVDAFVSLHIAPVNDPPVAGNVTLSYTEGVDVTTYLAKDVLKNSSDIDTLEDDVIYLHSVAMQDAAQGEIDNVTTAPIPGKDDGSVYIVSFDYKTPHSYFDEDVKIRFEVRDRAGVPEEISGAVLTLKAETKNDAPIFRPIAGEPEDPDKKLEIEMDEDGQWTVPIQYRDAETLRKDLTITITSANEEVVSKGNVTITPRADADGENIINFTGGADLVISPWKDQFSNTPFDVIITVSDGQNSVSQTISLTVREVPDKPVTPTQTFSTMEATELSFAPLQDVTDADPGDTFKLEGVVFAGGKDDDGNLIGEDDLPGVLTVDKDTGICKFEPGPTFVGSLEFTYTVSDKHDQQYTYPDTFRDPGYPGYEKALAGTTYDGKSSGTIIIRVGDSSVGPSLQRPSPIIAYAGQNMATRQLLTKNVKNGDTYKLSVQVIGGPVDPASIKVDNQALSTTPTEFTAAKANPTYDFDFALLSGVVGQSIVRFTIASEEDGETRINTMSFTVTTHAENLPPTLRSPVVLETEPEKKSGAYNTFEIDAIALADIADPEGQTLTFGTISSTGLGSDIVRIKPKGDSYVLEYLVRQERSANTNNGLHSITLRYTVLDEGGQTGIQVDEHGDPVKKDGEEIPYGEITVRIQSENHNPYTNGYITVAKWDEEDDDTIVLPRGSWDPHAYDTDGDIQYLLEAWCRDGDNTYLDENSQTQPLDGDEVAIDFLASEEIIQFKPLKEGWIKIRFRVKSRFKNDEDNPWDHSSEAGSVINIYVPPKGENPGLIPPMASGGWVERAEDTGLETFHQVEITSWLYGDGSAVGNPDLDLEIVSFDHAGSNNVGKYKIVEAQALKTTDENGKHHYYIEYRQAPNANSYTNADGDLTDTLTYPQIRFRISNSADLPKEERTAFAEAIFTARITSVNDAPVIGKAPYSEENQEPDGLKLSYQNRPSRDEPVEDHTETATAGQDGSLHAEITIERGTTAEMEFAVTDPDYPTQSKCNSQINVSLTSSDNLAVVANQSVYIRPEAGSAIWKIQFKGFLPGDATLTVKAYDENGQVSENIITIDVHVEGANRSPVAYDHYGVFDEDTKAAVKVFYEDGGENDSDPDGDPVYIVLIDTAHDKGKISVEGDKIIFIPANDFCHDTTLEKNEGTMTKPEGEDSWKDDEAIAIQFRLEDEVKGDSKGISQVKTLYLHFNPINDPPRFLAVQQKQDVMEINPASPLQYGEVTVTVTDVEDSEFTTESFTCSFGEDDPVFAESAAVIHNVKDNKDGTFTVTIRVTPNHYQCHLDENNLSQLTITAKDSKKAEASTVISVNVRPVNDPPRFKGDNAENPVFGDPLYGNPIVVTLDQKDLQTNEDIPIHIDIISYFVDPDGDTIDIINLTSLPNGQGHGTVKFDDKKALFTPTKDYFTPEDQWNDHSAWGGFKYTLTDGVSGTVYLRILPVNDAPVAKNMTYTVLEDHTLEITNLFAGKDGPTNNVYDVDNDLDELYITKAGTGSTAGVTGENVSRQGGTLLVRERDNKRWEIVYTPALDFSGTDTFFYTVTDGKLSATAQITVTVTADDDPPRANFQGSDTWKKDEKIDIGEEEPPTWVMDEDEKKTFLYNAWDPENRNITVLAEPKNLQTGIPGNTNCSTLTELLPKSGITYTGSGVTREILLEPSPDKYGSFTLLFTISDGNKESVYEIPVEIRPVNDAPALSDQSWVIDEGETLSKSIQGSDKETAAANLTYRRDPAKTAPTRGDVTVNSDGSYTYIPKQYYYGKDSFWIEVTDRGKTDSGDGPKSTSAEVVVDITPVNNAPEPPTDLTLSGTGHYKGGEEVVLQWGGAIDPFNETLRDEITYEISYSTNGVTWTEEAAITAATDDDGATWKATLPPAATQGKNTEGFRIRIRGVDDGKSYTHTGDVAYGVVVQEDDPLPSGWLTYGPVKIDSAAPGLSHAPTVFVWTNQDVVLTLTGNKGALDGASDIAKIQYKKGADDYEDLPLTGNVATYTAKTNGDYLFRVWDEVGNISADYTVTVAEIDRVKPVASVKTDNASGKHMGQIPHVLLNFTDPAANASNGDEPTDQISGVKTKQQYQLVAKDSPPVDGEWLTCTGDRVNFLAKGSYTLHTRTVDNAGNEKIQNLGDFTVINAVPAAENLTLTLYEHSIGDNPSSKTVTLDASDHDTGDTLTYAFAEDGAYDKLAGYVTIASVTSPDDGSGQYTFTHKGGHVPDDDTEITLKYKANDGTADSAETTVTVTLVRVNDAPSQPGSFAVSPLKTHYKAGNAMALSWVAGGDEETSIGKLRYELEYTLGGNSWESVATVQNGGIGYSYTAPAGNSNAFALRIRTVDDNGETSGNGYVNADGNGSGNAVSGWVELGPFSLDSTAPTAAHTILPESDLPGNGYSIVTITPADGDLSLQPWQSGVKEIQLPTGASAVDGGTPYQYRIPSNGTHTFTIVDNAGNETPYYVNALAPTDPAIAYSERFTKRGNSFAVAWTHSTATTGNYYELQLSYNGGTTWETLISKSSKYTGLSHGFTVPNTAPDTPNMLFRVRAWDDKGLPSANWSQGELIVCDSTKPVITITPSTEDLLSGDVTVTVQITDSPAGISSLTESKTGSYSGNPPANDNRIFDYTTVYTFTENGTVNIAVTDRCGNTNSAVYTVSCIDTSPPTLGLRAVSNSVERDEEDEVNHPYLFTLTFADTGVAGLDETRYAIIMVEDDPAPEDWVTAEQLTVTQQRAPIGDYYVHLYARDKAGNVTTLKKGPYHIVNTLPRAIPFGVTVQEAGNVLIQLRGEDDDPGDFIDAFMVTRQPEHGTLTPVDGVPGLYEYTHDGVDPTTDTWLEYTVTDARGSDSAAVRVEIKVLEVNDPPEITPELTAETMWWNSELEVELEAFDPDDAFETLRVSFRSSDSSILPENRIRLVREEDAQDPRSGKITLQIRPLEGQYTQDEPIRISVTVRDPAGLTDYAIVEVAVEPHPLPPEAADHYFFVAKEGYVSSSVKAELGFMGDSLRYEFTTDGYDTTLGTFYANTAEPDGPEFKFEASAGFVEGSVVGIPMRIIQTNIDGWPDDLTKDITLHFRSEAVTFENKDSDIIVTSVPSFVAAPNDPEAGVDADITTDQPQILRADKCRLVVNEQGDMFLYYTHESYRYGRVTVTLEVDGETLEIPIVIYPVNDPPELATSTNAVEASTLASPFMALRTAFAPLTASVRSLGATRTVETSASIYLGEALTGKVAADDRNDNHKPNDGSEYDLSYECPVFRYSIIVPPEHGELTVSENGSFTYLPDEGYLGEDLFSVLVAEAWGHIDNRNPENPPDAEDVSDIVDVSGTDLPSTGVDYPAEMPLLARSANIRVTITEKPVLPPNPTRPKPDRNTGSSGRSSSGTPGAVPSGFGGGPSLQHEDPITEWTEPAPATGGAPFFPQQPASGQTDSPQDNPPGALTDSALGESAPVRPAPAPSDVTGALAVAAVPRQSSLILRLWLLAGILIAGLLLLLADSMIRIRLCFEENGEEKEIVARKRGRIRRSGEETLLLTLSEEELPHGATSIHIRFGWLYRRGNFYGRPICLIYGQRQYLGDIPEKKAYQSNGREMSILPDDFQAEEQE